MNAVSRGNWRVLLELPVLSLLWGVAVVAGMACLVVYQNAPGPQPAQIPALAPGATHTKPELVLFLHPLCPCSQATVTELDRIASTAHGALDIKVWFVQPDRATDTWTDSSLITRARAISGVKVDYDRDGKEARRLGIATSGQAILFDTGGHAVFHGGITASRGHEGDNVGSAAILTYVRTGKVPVKKTPVFGCLLGDLGATKERA